MNSPNGQPAMYEYRNGNPHDPAVYGKVDKPSFLWAGGWYLYSMYHLLGMRENVWNLSFNPWLAEGMDASLFTVFMQGRPVEVRIHGEGEAIHRIAYDGEAMPTAVAPSGFAGERIDILLGEETSPYLTSTEAILESCNYDEGRKTLTMQLKAFAGHASCVDLVSPWDVRSLRIDGEVVDGWRSVPQSGLFRIHVAFTLRTGDSVVEVGF